MRRHTHPHRHAGDAGHFDGRRSRRYDFMASRLLRRVYRRLARDVAWLAGEGASVLDVGTGPGVLLVELAELRPDLRLTGLDLSADMIAAARRKLVRYGDRASAVTGDVADLPFEEASFDLIVSSVSLHHWSQPGDAAAELARVLRPGGVVCVYDFASAPFDELTGPLVELAAPGQAAGPDRVAQRTRVRPGIPFVPTLTRVLYAAPPGVTSAPDS
jgi:ubiquinone/menaquinone biosynthesis C-methylase UbiE